MARTYGTVELKNGEWHVTAEAHVMMRLKAVLPKVNKGQIGTVTISNTPANCHELKWFLARFPLEVKSVRELNQGSRAYQQKLEHLEIFRRPDYVPPKLELAKPLRDYQSLAAHLFMANGFLLVGDDVGLGKTPTALGPLSDPEFLPAVVVCQAQLTYQWADEQIPKFLPGLKTHIIKQCKRYTLPPADVYVITYSKLSDWAEYIRQTLKPSTIIYDEVHELRHEGSMKYMAARKLAETVPHRLGLSATPIYNYGDEMFAVANVLSPNFLGTKEEFEREWCISKGTKKLIADTKSFGSYLRENSIMLARSRREVGRELPPLTKVIHTVEHSHAALDEIKESAVALAKQILTGAFVERGQATREFDLKLRQATDIAKAAAAADYIEMLAGRGQKVLVGAWHREVYTILMTKLRRYNPVLYTGSEDANAKQRAKEAFIHGKSDVMLMSLRSAQGIDGLQDVCDVCVLAELDWSPAVHEQFIGRINRDRASGEPNKVTSIFLVSDSGSDPVMAEILGLKTGQVEGIMDKNRGDDLSSADSVDPDRIKKLAEEYLRMAA